MSQTAWPNSTLSGLVKSSQITTTTNCEFVWIFYFSTGYIINFNRKHLVCNVPVLLLLTFFVYSHDWKHVPDCVAKFNTIGFSKLKPDNYNNKL